MGDGEASVAELEKQVADQRAELDRAYALITALENQAEREGVRPQPDMAAKVAELQRQIDDLLPYKMRCCQLDLQAVLDKHDVNLAPQTTFGITPRK